MTASCLAHSSPTETVMKSPATASLLCFAALASFVAAPALALKYAASEHQLQADPAIPSWKPGEVASVPEEALNLVGADVMDEITLGWVKMFRKAYPKLSVTMEARASGTGGPASMFPCAAQLGPLWPPAQFGACGAV